MSQNNQTSYGFGSQKYIDFSSASDSQRYADTDYERSLLTTNQSQRISSNVQDKSDIPDFVVNEQNADKVLAVFNKFKYINPLILTQFISGKLNISTLPKQTLLQKNQPYLNAPNSSIVFSNLVDMFYLQSTPQYFQEKYLSYTGRYNFIYNFYFLGIAVYGFAARRLSKKSVWFKLTKSNNFLMKNIFFMWVTLMLINEFYLSGLRGFCKNHIEVVDSVFETHLKMIKSHGVDLKKAIDYYSRIIQNSGTQNNEGQSNSNNPNIASNSTFQSTNQLDHQIISSYNIQKCISLPIPSEILSTQTVQKNNELTNIKKSDYLY